MYADNVAMLAFTHHMTLSTAHSKPLLLSTAHAAID